MKLLGPVNSNYCANVVQITALVPLAKCDNIQGTFIFGNHVIVSKDTKVGDLGIYFPVETQIDNAFLRYNSLYRDKELNEDKQASGFFELNGRVRAIKLRGYQSNGIWFPLSLLSYLPDQHEFKIGDCFDAVAIPSVGTLPICRKYVSVNTKKQRLPGSKRQRRSIKCSKTVSNQFKFHQDTAQLGKNIHKIEPKSLISVTYKMHGTSFISSKLLCKRKPSFLHKLLWLARAELPLKTEYDYLYASRKVIKNDDVSFELFRKPLGKRHYYELDIWGMAHDKIKEFLLDGMSVYGEAVGYLPNGGMIQKEYDYGCAPNEFDVFVYRVTFTNHYGHVFEFSAKQVQDWCKERGLKAVPELYYGTAEEFFRWDEKGRSEDYYYNGDLSFEDNLLSRLKERYLEVDCFMCANKVPAEGVVLRKETLGFDAYKLKSFKFLERETKLLDKGETNIEDNQGGIEDSEDH